MTLVQAGEAYRYEPSVSNPTERVLSYNVVNKPDWATFNETTGELSRDAGCCGTRSPGGVNSRVENDRATAVDGCERSSIALS